VVRGGGGRGWRAAPGVWQRAPWRRSGGDGRAMVGRRGGADGPAAAQRACGSGRRRPPRLAVARPRWARRARDGLGGPIIGFYFFYLIN